MATVKPLVLGFRSASYAMGIYMYGTNRLTARDGFTGVAAGYYAPVEQYAANNYQKSDIDNALAMTWIDAQEYAETLALILLPTPVAPNVNADDVNNVIIGIDSTMEYAIDQTTTYTAYNSITPPDLSGAHTVNIRVAAVPLVNNASLPTVLTFTAN